MKRIALTIAAAAALAPMGAAAESVTMTGVFAAPNREASMLGSIAVGRISGQDGQTLQIALERALAWADGEFQFEVFAGRGGRGNADGQMDGVVTTGVDENGYIRKDKKCVERDAKEKCIKEETVDVRCRRRIVTINADLRLARNDGRILYSTNKPFREETSWCAEQRPSRSVDEIVQSALTGIANSVRADISIDVDRYSVRFRESTKNMRKDQVKAWKALIKQTQRDLAGACRAFEELAQDPVGHPSVLYNVGLCAEAAGEYAKAADYYRAAAPLIGGRGGEAADGIGRVARLVAGRGDLDERARRLGRRQ
jgi:hypothetical protein